MPLTDKEIIVELCTNGGTIHGPITETVSIPLDKYLELRRKQTRGWVLTYQNEGIRYFRALDHDDVTTSTNINHAVGFADKDEAMRVAELDAMDFTAVPRP